MLDQHLFAGNNEADIFSIMQMGENEVDLGIEPDDKKVRASNAVVKDDAENKVEGKGKKMLPTDRKLADEKSGASIEARLDSLDSRFEQVRRTNLCKLVSYICVFPLSYASLFSLRILACA